MQRCIYRNNIRILAAVLFAVTLSSCGYRLSGTGAIVPAEYRTIAVATFLNRTNEPYVDTQLSGAVAQEFLNDGRLRVTGSEEADVVLRGSVIRYSVTALSYTADSYVKQYRVHVAADVRLEDRRTGKVLWQEGDVQSNLISSYTVEFDANDPVTGLSLLNISKTKMSKEEAIRKAGRDLAQTIRSRVLEGF